MIGMIDLMLAYMIIVALGCIATIIFYICRCSKYVLPFVTFYIKNVERGYFLYIFIDSMIY